MVERRPGSGRRLRVHVPPAPRSGDRRRYANLYYPIRNAEAVAKGKAAPTALGVRAIDDRTLEVTLERPTPYFLAVVAHQTSASVNPRNVAEFGRAFARPGNLVSNGAFRLAAFTPNDETVLVKNPHFHAARDVAIDKEIIASIDDRAAAFLRFRAGEIDSDDDAPADELAFVRKTLKDEFHVAPTLGVLYLAFNTKKPPFDDARLRNALSMVIDREFLAGAIWGGAMAPAYAFVPPGINNYVTGVAAAFRELSPIEREERALSAERSRLRPRPAAFGRDPLQHQREQQGDRNRDRRRVEAARRHDDIR
jgi:ABC-type oligopeptide transport system substrate-binding subunit